MPRTAMSSFPLSSTKIGMSPRSKRSRPLRKSSRTRTPAGVHDLERAERICPSFFASTGSAERTAGSFAPRLRRNDERPRIHRGREKIQARSRLRVPCRDRKACRGHVLHSAQGKGESAIFDEEADDELRVRLALFP